jgi:nucleoside-diphosphate-sugar epimerase
MAATNRLREEGTRNLVDAAARVGTRRFVSQSIAFAYDPAAQAPANEEQALFDAAPSGFDAAVRAIRSCEKATLEDTDIEGVVLRYGHFCGPGTAYAPGGATFAAVKAGRMPIIGNGDGVFSFIHVHDAALATVRSLSSPATGTFNIVDDTPVALSDWLPWFASSLDAGKPRRMPRWLGRLLAGRFADYFMSAQIGASNTNARNRLDWKPMLATWQDGLGESIRDR